MALDDPRAFVPDEKILSDIFPSVIGLKRTSCNIISNTFDTCSLCLCLETLSLSDYPKNLFVRLETSERSLATLAALQRLTRSALGGLVPQVLHVGFPTTAAGKEVNYLVTEYLAGTIPIEDVWDTLDETRQLELMKLFLSSRSFRSWTSATLIKF